DRLDVRGLRALGALHNLERHALAFGPRLVAFHANGREVDEDVIAALALDEAVALLVGEPLNGALWQLRFLLTTNDGTTRSRRPPPAPRPGPWQRRRGGGGRPRRRARRRRACAAAGPGCASGRR